MNPLKNGIRFLLENSLFLIGGTALALIYANLDHHGYHHLVHAEAAKHITLHFVVNDVLMCFFFALAAKEIWEALLPGGALSSPKKAATPLLATAGGIMGPAGLYVLGALYFDAGDLVRGWAIPCATDIAFSYLVARLIFGKGHPAIPFLLLLAIADDAAGLIILAVAYPTGEMHLVLFFGCVVGAILFNVLVLRKGLKAQNFWLYLVVAAPLSWYGFFKGGIHPALALVPVIPTLPHAAQDSGFFEGAEDDHPQDPLNKFEHWWKNPVELILMFFGFANAGVAFGAMGLPTWLVTRRPAGRQAHRHLFVHGGGLRRLQAGAAQGDELPRSGGAGLHGRHRVHRGAVRGHGGLPRRRDPGRGQDGRAVQLWRLGPLLPRLHAAWCGALWKETRCSQRLAYTVGCWPTHGALPPSGPT